MNTLVEHKSYAQGLKNGKSVSKTGSHSRVHDAVTNVKSVQYSTQYNLGIHTDCVPGKCVPFKRNADHPASSGKCCHLEHNEARKGKLVMQDPPFTITNRFQILASNEDIVNEQQTNAEHGNFFGSQLKGNKNETGQMLSQKSCENASTSVDISITLEGNKNKTGKNWDMPHRN